MELKPFSINITPKFTISGSLSSLIKGLEQVSDALPESFVGLPIHDEHGNKIGTITHIDVNLWYGEVDNQQEFLNNMIHSKELIVENGEINER